MIIWKQIYPSQNPTHSNKSRGDEGAEGAEKEEWASRTANNKCPMAYKSKWVLFSCSNENRFMCSRPIKVSINSNTSLVFTSQNIPKIPAIILRWESQPSSQTSEEPGVIGGLTLNWALKSSANDLNGSKPEWKIKNQRSSFPKDMNMMTIMNLVRETKKQGVREDQVWTILLTNRWNMEILKTDPCLNETQILKVIHKTGEELNIAYSWNLWIPEEDLTFGTELYSALHYCPGKLIEAAKLSALFESLITNHNLNTVVAATMHNIQPRAGDNIKDFTAINMWYQRMDERYTFSLHSSILPLMTSDEVKQLLTLEPPFMTNDTQPDKEALDTLSPVFGKKL